METATADEVRPSAIGLAEDVSCPLCSYNLRGLVEPRCPECGYRFAWVEVLDPARRLHPYLFEHHPERNLWSFRKTLLGGWRPRRFWTSLHPVQPAFIRRLLVYWLICGMFALMLVVALFGGYTAQIRMNAVWQRATATAMYNKDPKYRASVDKQWGSLPAMLNAFNPVMSYTQVAKQLLGTSGFVRQFCGETLVSHLPLVVWSWFSFVTLLIFQASMRRARISVHHVLRCVVYSLDVIIWIFIYCFVVYLFRPPAVYAYRPPWYSSITAVLTLAAVWLPGLALGALGMYRLAVAFELYLRFDRPWLTVLASQVIVALIFFNLVFLEVWS